MTKQYEVSITVRSGEGVMDKIRALRGVFSFIHPSTGETQFMLSLKESFWLINEARDGGVILYLSPKTALELSEKGFIVKQPNNISKGIVDDGSEEIITVRIYKENDGLKIQAVRTIRAALGYGLIESKDLIEEIWQDREPVVVVMTKREATILIDGGFVVEIFPPDTGPNHFEPDLFEMFP
jgi:ribosomal protein L7/L12